MPLPRDYDGDGKADFAVWRPSTGEWFIRHSRDGSVTQRQWGVRGDLPIPGDYDGDGRGRHVRPRLSSPDAWTGKSAK